MDCMNCGEITLNEKLCEDCEVKKKNESDKKIIDLKEKIIRFLKVHHQLKFVKEKEIEALTKKYINNQAELWNYLPLKYPKRERTLSTKLIKNGTNPFVVIDTLKIMYNRNIKPLEELYKFSYFESEPLTENEFDAKPIVLCVGQYSTGKTTFIKYLLEREFPGIRIGPEPTTDRFVAIMYNKNENVIPGNVVAVHRDKPFTGLQKYGMQFLNKFQCSSLPSPILKYLTFIDTPGVLAGSENSRDRLYNLPDIVRWFANKSDRILLFFDSHKLDTSDELKNVLKALKGNDDKIRCILNKSDTVSNQELMRVYGALMWSLGKVIKTPEVIRIYIGSFWDRPYKNKENSSLFEAETNDLLADLRFLPKNSTIRKINELVKRIRKLKIHIRVLSHLRKQIGIFKKKKKQDSLLTNISEEFKKVSLIYDLPSGDFPDEIEFKNKSANLEIYKFPKNSDKYVNIIEKVLARDIPNMLKRINEQESLSSKMENNKENGIYGNLNKKNDNNVNKAPDWVISGSLKSKYDNEFFKNCEGDNKITINKVEKILEKYGHKKSIIDKILDLSDIDQNKEMDIEEFAVCMYLTDKFNCEGVVPNVLPVELIPPSKRIYIS